MTNETKSPAQSAPVVAASELSDEQIEAIAAHAYRNTDKLNGWSGFSQDDNGKYMVPDLTPKDLQLCRVMLAAAPAVQQPAEGGTPEAPLLTITGTLVELGDMKAGRGFAVETSESTYVELIGLSEQGVQDVASQFYSAVTITVRPAAPTQAEGV